MSSAPSVDGYKDTIADLALDCLGKVTFAGRVLNQKHLTGAYLADFAVACGDLDAGVEIDDVLAAGCRMPIEVVGWRDFAENDAGRRQALRELTRARLLDPLDFDVPEVRLTIGVGVEVMYPHPRPSLKFARERSY